MTKLKEDPGLLKDAYTNISRCRVCGSTQLTEVMKLNEQYLSSAFVKSNRGNALAKLKVPLTLVLCDKARDPKACGVLQLRETVRPDLMYRNYFYRSTTNETMRNDLRDVVADSVSRVAAKEGDVFVDIGANDGTMVSFAPPRFKRFGVEPARNISWDRLDPSITIVNDYFSRKALQASVREPVKIFTCCAMFYDLDDPGSFVEDIRSTLAVDGIWCAQLSYLALMLKNMNFYDICHEHLMYYSLATLKTLLERHGMMIFDASTNPVNGGSIRVFAARDDGGRRPTPALARLLAEEEALRLFDPATYVAFKGRIEDLGRRVRRYLENEIRSHRRVLGLGASTKGNVLLQHFGISKEMISCISEINPEKFYLRTLGSDIELIPDAEARKLNPSCMLVLPWYFKSEIIRNERNYLKSGGRLLFPMPYPHLVSAAGETAL